MIPDKLLINLKIISKIQKNGRIARSYDGIISLETDQVYQSLKRFLTSDSRKQAIFEINSIISECIDTINYNLNSKFMNIQYCQTEEYFKNCENLNLLITELGSSKYGIENLKFTYQNDPNIVTQLDILILKIMTTIRDVGQKIYYFQSHIPNIQNRQFYSFDYNIQFPPKPNNDIIASPSSQTQPLTDIANEDDSEHIINMNSVTNSEE
jgi:hypothetical protein